MQVSPSRRVFSRLQQRSSGQDRHLHPCKWPLQVISSVLVSRGLWCSNNVLEKEAQILSWTMPSVCQRYSEGLQQLSTNSPTSSKHLPTKKPETFKQASSVLLLPLKLSRNVQTSILVPTSCLLPPLTSPFQFPCRSKGATVPLSQEGLPRRSRLREALQRFPFMLFGPTFYPSTYEFSGPLHPHMSLPLQEGSGHWPASCLYNLPSLDSSPVAPSLELQPGHQPASGTSVSILLTAALEIRC